MHEFAVFHAPICKRPPREVFRWCVESAIDAERAGCSEVWIAEHSTLNYECVPSPELVLGGAALQTDRIKLCVGAHLPAYHNAATLAVQTAWMSHVLEGRYILGIGAGAFESDAQLHGYPDVSGNPARMREALDVMDKIWRWEPFEHDGEHHRAGWPHGVELTGEPFRDSKPWGGTMPIGMAAASPDSRTIAFAAERGYLPMTLLAPDELTRNHWDTYARVAAEHGRTGVTRADQRVVKIVFCAETDAEARRLAIEGPMGQGWVNYAGRMYTPLLDAWYPDVSRAEIETWDWLFENFWIVGSPDTVREKMEAAFEVTGGGWGTSLILAFDWLDDPAAFNASNALLCAEVAPKLKVKTD